MDTFTHDALRIDAALNRAKPAIELRWLGRSTDRQPRQLLGPYLSSAIEQAAERQVALEMRFEDLEYFNSATVMAIIQSVHAARERGVRLRIVYDDALDWQRLSFDPMRVFEADGMLELEPAPRGASGGSEA